MSRWGGNNDAMKRSRGRSGGAASSASPKRYAPLREVTAAGLGCETLECGHEIRTPHDLIGETSAFRRRCLECLILSCSADNHPFDVERGGIMTCRCGEGDDALRHLVGWHGQDTDELSMKLGTLPEARALHESLTAAGPGRRVHYHWEGDEWTVRTRPEHLRRA